MIRSFLSTVILSFCTGHVSASDASYESDGWVVTGGVVVLSTDLTTPVEATEEADDLPTLKTLSPPNNKQD